MKDRLTLFTKYILDFMFFAGIVVIITLPGIIKFVAEYNEYFKKYYFLQLFLYFVSGVFAILIIGELRKIFKTVISGDCFRKENVQSLKRMGNYSFVIALSTIFRGIIYMTTAVIVIVLVFVIAGLFSKVLSKVFDRAVYYKLENDMTI
ncbi:MAG: DUF2975 domain-containing protein [Lachnospiraceae bacterium]|nr:DUF2975 domain-containing protein [Lachnospiraceae bacterium]